MRWMYLMAASLLLAAGCSTSAASHAGEDAAADGRVGAQADGERHELAAFAPEAAQAQVTSLAWAGDGTLRVGYADGIWAHVDPKTREGDVEAVLAEEAAVLAVSPAAKLALVLGEYPVVVRLRDQRVVMRLRAIDQVQEAGFFAGGRGFYVVEPSGNLHVWSHGEAALDEISSTDLKELVARQTPAFTARLAPLGSATLLAEGDELFLGTRQGKVLRWNPSEPGDINVLVKLPDLPKSFGYGRSHLAATTQAGELRVVDMMESTFVPWSLEASGDLVAASPMLDGAFAVADASAVGVRQFKDGAFRWAAGLPSGERCGLALSPKADLLAICIDSGILLVDAQNGEPLAALRRNADDIEWR